MQSENALLRGGIIAIDKHSVIALKTFQERVNGIIIKLVRRLVYLEYLLIA